MDGSQLLLKRKANPTPMTGLITASSVVITKSFMVITRYSRFGVETRYLHRPPRARRDIEWLEFWIIWTGRNSSRWPPAHSLGLAAAH